MNRSSFAAPIPSSRSLLFGMSAVAVASLVGVLTVIDVKLAVAAIIAFIAVPAAVLKPKVMVYMLVFTIVGEALMVGGITVGRLAAPIALIAVFAQFLKAPARLRGARPTLVLVTGYALLALASAAWSVSLGLTLGTVASLAISLVYMAAFATLLRTHEDLYRLLWALVISSTMLAILWITQFASGVDRRFNSVGDPNFFAAIQVVVLPLAVVLLATQKGLKRGALYVAIALIADSVISTLSRGGFVTLLLVVLLVMLLPARALFPSRREKTAFFVTASFGLMLLFPLAWGGLSHRFQQGFNESNLAGGRGDLWAAALNGYRQHPLTGLGYGAFKGVSFQLLRVTPGVDLASHLRFAAIDGEYVHNAYVGSLAELGPIGLFFFLGIMVATLRSLRRAARYARLAGEPLVRGVANALTLGLLAFAISSFLLSTETSRSLWLIVGLSLALTAMVAPGARTPRLWLPPPARELQGAVGATDTD